MDVAVTLLLPLVAKCNKYMSKIPVITVTIKDCRVDTFRAGGKGGQKQNKTNSGVRIVHEPSGAVGESREHRDQLTNKRAAFKRMAQSEKMQKWLKIESLKKLGELKDIEQKVDKMMEEKNLKVEYF